ncbi:DNA/RNA helicase domain-containing protein [Streptomyces griseorubiginosus]|uniref:DNA/RNA helicase domain-containing protein n=1 Tax=Streptomyces griseorubiginosus TaxID=67304 RepID=UPI0036C3E60A
MLLAGSASEIGLLLSPQPDTSNLPLTDRLISEHRKAEGNEPSPGEIASWNNSIPVVINQLLACGLGEAQVLVEFGLPHTDSAVDLVLCGQRPGTGTPSYVALELKQVRHATVHPECPTVVDLGYGEYKPHPVRQIQRYCEYMTRYLPPLRENGGCLTGAAFLHNARDEHVSALFDLPETPHGTLYTLDDLELFRRMLTSCFTEGSGSEAARILIEAKRDPLRKVTDIARQRSVTGGGLTLLDEQQMAFDLILRHVERAVINGNSGRKRVFIFRGGPGSGKSAVALEMQRELGLRCCLAVLASGSHAYTETLRETLLNTARQGEVSRKRTAGLKMYRYFNSFQDAEPDSEEVIICDEAHRMRRSSTDRWTTPENREEDRPQVDELLTAARIPIFLLDDHQSIRPDEVGTATYLREYAESQGCQVTVSELEGTFRAGGSRRYQGWVQQLLGFTDLDAAAWKPDGRMQLLVADSPNDLEEFVRERHLEGATARITAGYCWAWSNPKDGVLVPDVQIGDWHRPWNVKPQHHVPDAPSASLWATDRRGIDQIGCVYTAQTFEYDWNAVIIGPDLLWRDGRFVVNRSASKDPAFRGAPDDIVQRCILNAYHVLLTRGVVGTVVYSQDTRTQSALRRLIPGTISRQQISGSPTRPLTAEGAAVPPSYRKRRQ